MTALTENSSDASFERPSFLVHVALSTISIAQPFFSVTGTNLNFFSAWRMTGMEFACLTFIVYGAPPLVTYLLVSLGYRLHRQLGRALAVVTFFLYISAASALALRHLGAQAQFAPTMPQVLGGGAVLLVLSTVLASLLLSKPMIRGAVAFFGAVTIIFPALMLLRGYELGVIAPRQVPPAERIHSASLPNIVMIVYDELPLTTILDADGLIDRRKFPNFYQLAQDGTWLANARSLSGSTETAVPAILSGRLAKGDVPPTYKNYPENIFWTLGPSYNVLDLQTVTNLNPFTQSHAEEEATSFARYRRIALDTGIIVGHIVVPPIFATGLPPITRQQNRFGEDVAASPHGLPQHERFMKALANAKAPFLAVYHNIYPHNSWTHFPSGTPCPSSRWGDYISLVDLQNTRLSVDPGRIRQDYQAHLFQSMHADKLLGELLAQLKKTGVYDSSMIVVVADHGVTLWPGEHPRNPNVSHNTDVFAVPLIIRAPRQRHPRIMMDRVRTVDIYPTILDYLGVASPAGIDGKSFLESLRQAPAAETVRSMPYRADPTLRRRTRWFGTGDSSADLYGFGEFREYIGHSVNEFTFTTLSDAIVRLWGPDGVRRTAVPDAARIDAEIVGGTEDGEVRSILVALGDRFCGATRTTDLREKGAANSFTLILAEECLDRLRKRALRVFVRDAFGNLAEIPVDRLSIDRVTEELAELVASLRGAARDEQHGPMPLARLRKLGVAVPNIFVQDGELAGPWGNLTILKDEQGWIIDFYSAPEKACATLVLGGIRIPGVTRIAASALAKDEMSAPVAAEQARRACAKADMGFVRIIAANGLSPSRSRPAQAPLENEVNDALTQLIDSLARAPAVAEGTIDLPGLRALGITVPQIFAASDRLAWPWGDVAIQKDGRRWIVDLYSPPEALCKSVLLRANRIKNVARVATSGAASDEMVTPVTPEFADQKCQGSQVDVLRITTTDGAMASGATVN